ncbi:hypothetical protein [Mycolicibacterium sarraceniae]|uniref:Uncharacterized protein n=1 Tax=Mycolicibacterium sarraceniae TaxID=1534348 RepID=A0A7I7SKB6_9MYCO|nr:hypothetical protein [Mycolicibacterium sarraceniae]BBY57173.1 hypothetical protein MSAR_03090 [Mycolicibacterium sarraceniae]
MVVVPSDGQHPSQIADLERIEEQGAPAEQLLKEARSYASLNLRGQVDFGHVPDPSGAMECHEWQERHGSWSREFTGHTRSTGRNTVTVIGKQDSTGAVVQTWLEIRVNDAVMGTSTADARELAAAIVAAADEAEEIED